MLLRAAFALSMLLVLPARAQEQITFSKYAFDIVSTHAAKAESKCVIRRFEGRPIEACALDDGKLEIHVVFTVGHGRSVAVCTVSTKIASEGVQSNRIYHCPNHIYPIVLALAAKTESREQIARTTDSSLRTLASMLGKP